MLPYLIEDDSLKNEMITWNAVVLLLILGVILGYALHNYWIRHRKLKEIDHYNWVKFDMLGLDNVGLISKACKLAGLPFGSSPKSPLS